MQVIRLDVTSEKDRSLMGSLLRSLGLKLERGVEESYGVFEGGRILATGSLLGRSLRMIATDPDYGGSEALHLLMTHLIERQMERGHVDLALWTKPEAALSFERMGFELVFQTAEVVFLENTPGRFDGYLKRIGKHRVDGGVSGAIVMNANPFTRGHRYLVERALAHCDHLHLFVVTEDVSIFPADVRFELVRAGVADLKNVTLHRTETYLVSRDTFPGYFLGSKKEDAFADLDLGLFARRIAPVLGIDKRFVGREPYCPVTRRYNERMTEILPAQGIEVVAFDRLTDGREAISASRVRRALSEGNWRDLTDWVPENTLQFLKGPDGAQVREKLKGFSGRH